VKETVTMGGRRVIEGKCHAVAKYGHWRHRTALTGGGWPVMVVGMPGRKPQGVRTFLCLPNVAVTSVQNVVIVATRTLQARTSAANFKKGRTPMKRPRKKGILCLRDDFSSSWEFFSFQSINYDIS
jgi:hypothetical protein